MSLSQTNKVCPFVGLPDDPTTSHLWPMPHNFCHRCRPKEPATLPHQERYCLTPNYENCPIYLGPAGKPLPHPFRLWPAPRSRWRRSVVVGLVILALSLLVAAWWYAQQIGLVI